MSSNRRHHEPRVAFVTTCKGRVQHLAQTLPQNLKDNAGYRNAVFIIVSYGDGPHTVRYLKEHHAEDLESGRVVLYHVLGVEQFKMAHAKNVAHRCGIAEGAEILVNVDADNFTGPHFAQWVADTFSGTPNCFVWARVIGTDGIRVGDRGTNGRIGVRPSDFLKAGGYDERYKQWGADDRDFNKRLCMLGLTGIEMPTRFMRSIKHGDGLRFREYPEARHNPYHGKDWRRPICGIANFGNVGVCQLMRNFDTIILAFRKGAATRVFGIGMHKTGTTSLHHALEILGCQSTHWPNPKWPKAVFNDMTEFGCSPLLDSTYAACDLPIPMFYKELDEAYPGAKFILTIRPDGDWLRSVERHFQHEYNPYRHYWDTNGTTHRLHSALFGRKTFDRAVFAERYRRHNIEVMQYFAQRTEDFLILPTGHARWESLCAFLGQPVPNESYPHLNATGAIK